MAEPENPQEGELADGAMLVVEKELGAPREEVWRCLTEPACFTKWWKNNVDFEPRQGSRFVEPWVDPSGRERRIAVELTAFHPPSGFVMVWADEEWDFETVVSVSLSDSSAGTLVRIEHQGWEQAPEPDRTTYLLDHRSRWTGRLNTLATHTSALRNPAPGEGLN